MIRQVVPAGSAKKMGSSGGPANSMSSSSGVKKNVQVVVRTRPMSDAEKHLKYRNIVGCDTVSRLVTLRPGAQPPQQQRVFGPFDRVYGQESTQVEVYNDVVAPLIREVLNGYNCTVFAYGQTGSGKTYTMEGHHDVNGEYGWENDPLAGLIPRALHHIFSVLGDQQEQLDYYSVRVSYVEMYNEQIYDLLSASDNSHQESLRIFDDKNKGVSIVGMEEVAVRSRGEVYALLKRGAEKRRTATTLMNINSSRSHSVFTVTVTMREQSSSVDGEELLRQGKINLVDLAGSENIGRSGATDKRAREAGNINVSLLSLGRVITALTANAPHIPYRESKLTRILQDSLGGKTITTIIATLSPASANFEESVNTLDYAQRAKNIKNNPEANQCITRKAILREYNEEIERLRRDLVAAREKTGIYLDKENYDRMLETIDENRERVEELEGQLESQLHQVKILLEDLQMMDEHYNSVYQDCRRAVEKLERRKLEVESLNRELYSTRDNLKAASSALAQSSNAFVKLRAQAYALQESCTIFYGDLEILHDRLDKLRATQKENDELLGHFAVTRIGEVSRAKRELHDFGQASSRVVEEISNALGTLTNGVTLKHGELMTHFDGILKGLASYQSGCVDRLLPDFETARGEAISDFKSRVGEHYTIMKSHLHSLDEKLSTVMRCTTAVELALQNHREKIEALTADARNSNSSHSTNMASILQRLQTCLTEMAEAQKSSSETNESNLRKIESLTAENTKRLTKKAGSAQRSGLDQQKVVKEIDSLADGFRSQQESYLIAERESGASFAVALRDGTSELQSTLAGLLKGGGLTAETLAQFVRENAAQLNDMAKQQQTLSSELVQSMSTRLAESQSATERFVHQEFKRIHSTGSTPVRRDIGEFVEDLVDVDSPAELIRKQQQIQTPRRASLFKGRDSLLDSMDLPASPGTLRQRQNRAAVATMPTLDES